MRTVLRRGLVVAAATAGLMIPGAALTATSAAAATPRPAAVTAQALPAYETWLADVTAVTDQASAYLNDRLPDTGIRPAIVLDIDNTALQSKYRPYLATPPVLALARQAQADGAAVFFVTARPELIKAATEVNLQVVGYRWTGLYTRPTFDFSDNQTLKTKARTDIERRGYTIVANVGNSASDLGGGHAERTFKLPDYDGQLD
ncbi:acid phosphatase [Amorphoplanes nipponensis]|uniref:Acid phosphatase n=1 Tax=Actinoplanes nipponensis TaxID=135950 RepID=A0A919JEA0_9ACTN|nr:HAD family acid phosphatase [Actinoplanes nipponensis]GIE49123.1 acid phosphatase [Actinoplanes nipponensis]